MCSGLLKLTVFAPAMTQIDGRERATVFVSPPPGVEWPQETDLGDQDAARHLVKDEDEEVD